MKKRMLNFLEIAASDTYINIILLRHLNTSNNKDHRIISKEDTPFLLYVHSIMMQDRTMVPMGRPAFELSLAQPFTFDFVYFLN